MSTNSSYAFWAGKNESVADIVKNSETGFAVTPQGKLYCAGATISGDLNAGSVGGWTIDSTGIWKGNTTLTSDGKLTCTSGDIGGWTIDSTSISATSNGKTTTLSSSGGITAISLNIGSWGTIGDTEGKTDSAATTNIGITSKSGSGIVLESATNIRLSALSSSTYDGVTIRGQDIYLGSRASGDSIHLTDTNGGSTTTLKAYINSLIKSATSSYVTKSEVSSMISAANSSSSN
jgi:hypothetical protein